jgi:hypothetical protein
MAQQHPQKSKAAYNNTGPIKEQMMGMIALPPPRITPEFNIRGRVVNEDGQPVPYASVNLEKPGRLVVADSAGRFTIDVQSMDGIELSASAAGYEPLEGFSVDVDPIPVKSVKIKNKRVVMDVGDLQLKKKVLKEVVVIGYPTITGKLSITTGPVSIVRADTFVTHVDTIVNKIQKTINKITGRSEIKNSGDVKVYPNPAPANGSFFVQFNIKEAGEYNVQFIDASGRIVAGKPLVIAAPGQVEAYPAAGLQGHGMYFIRVAGAKDGKLYNARLEIL